MRKVGMSTAWLYMYMRRVSLDICQETEIREKPWKSLGSNFGTDSPSQSEALRFIDSAKIFQGFFFHNIWLQEVNVFLTWCIVSSLQYALFTLVGREYDFTAVSHVQLTLSSYYLFLFFFFFFLFGMNRFTILYTNAKKTQETKTDMTKYRRLKVPNTCTCRREEANMEDWTWIWNHGEETKNDQTFLLSYLVYAGVNVFLFFFNVFFLFFFFCFILGAYDTHASAMVRSGCRSSGLSKAFSCLDPLRHSRLLFLSFSLTKAKY